MSRANWTRRQLDILKARASVLIPLTCAGLYFYQFWHVWKYAVNLPYWDEWEVFTPGQLPAGFSLRSLFAQHNEHRVVTTRLLIWLLYRLDGWNVATHQVLNFILYGVILVGLLWAARRLAPGTPAWLHLCFMLFLLSTISIENHLWAYQSVMHFWLLFFLAATYLLFDERQRTSRLLWGCAAAALSTYSLAAGIVSGTVLLASYAVFKSLRASAASGDTRKGELLQLLLVAFLVGVPIGLWTVGYQRPPGHALSSLFGAKFWDYYLNVIAFNFGVDSLSATAGAVCLLFVLAPLCLQIFREGRRLPAEQWAVLSAVLGSLAVLASISAGRAAFGPLQSKSSRYAELGMILIPLSALAWGLVLRHQRGLRATLLACLWVALCATFWDNWRFGDYLHHYGQRNLGVKCVRQYYLAGGDALCPRIYPAPLASKLDAARQLNASFYRELSLPEQGGDR